MTDRLRLAELVGEPTFTRGLAYARKGAVRKHFQLNGSTSRVRSIVGSVRGSAPRDYDVFATATFDPGGWITHLDSSCSCPVGRDCKHVVAMVHTAFDQAPAVDRTPTRNWRKSLDPIIDTPYDRTEFTEYPLALQFELTSPKAAYLSAVRVPQRVVIRPVRLGAKGRWIRTGTSWSALRTEDPVRPDRPLPTHLLALRTIADVAGSSAAHFGGSPFNTGQINSDGSVDLDAANPDILWELIGRAQQVGVQLINTNADQTPVVISNVTAEPILNASRGDNGLRLSPQLLLNGIVVEHRRWTLLGHPPHTVAFWHSDAGPATERELTFARLIHPPGNEVRGVLLREPIEVPIGEVDQFLTEFYPLLKRKVTVISADNSVEFPLDPAPDLSLIVEYQGAHQVCLKWQWSYRIGAETKIFESTSRKTDQRFRDPSAESAILDRIDLTSPAFRALAVSTPDGYQLINQVILSGMDTVRFLTEDLPLVLDSEMLSVIHRGTKTDYRPADSPPVVEIATSETSSGQDWLDLKVTITVDSQPIPFQIIFQALAQNRDHVILADGTFFPLDRAQFEQLGQLIAEARLVHEDPDGTIRVHRQQTSLFEELVRLGVLDEQARVWRQSLQGLLSEDTVEKQAIPSGLKATLRPYQQSGFDWLSFLIDRGLGGILADDMGLGKTLQTLAMISRYRQNGSATAPFLVIAPTSVVGNWKSEASKFTPELTVTLIGGAHDSDRRSLADKVDGSDIVITSYALFRLKFDDYDALPWAGVILDEAQFVKNHQSKAYQCAKKISAPFKLAITGTPMENSLMELWSLFSITAPGLFPAPKKFQEYYQRPIERDGDRDRLAQLRRRIRPVMLRRTKEEVATDLPAKQEQVLELELNPRQRKIYQTHLQRERQRILGLLDDLDKNRFAILRSLTLLRQISLAASLVDERHRDVPSTKLDVLLELLDDVIGEGHRCLIFSQFTSFLGLVRQRLDIEGIGYSYLDGTTRNRPEVIDEFKTGTNPLFLISLKAGGFGLNLTEADYCILLDPWWNPASETQAVDRTHRIGQTRQVMVYRLVAKDTIEEKVMALKATKSALFSSVLSEDPAAGAALTAADIKQLLD